MAKQNPDRAHVDLDKVIVACKSQIQNAKNQKNFQTVAAAIIQLIENALDTIKKQQEQIEKGTPDNISDPDAQQLVSDIQQFYDGFHKLPLSQKHKPFQALNKKVEKSQSQFKRILAHFDPILRQSSLVELFGSYLSENIPRTPLSKRELQSSTFQRSSKQIFPDTYEPYPGDPEASVPRSRTIDRMSGEEQRSLFSEFEAKKLQQDFREAFPWAISPSAVSEIDVEKVHDTFNLLGTTEPLDPKLQIEVIQVVLLVVDLMGRASGVDGSYVLSNFHLVKSLVAVLEHISDLIDTSPIEEETLKVQAQKQMTALLQAEAILKQHQKPKPYQNQVITDFCAKTEERSMHLLNLHGIRSVIVPEPPAPDQTKLRPQPS